MKVLIMKITKLLPWYIYCVLNDFLSTFNIDNISRLSKICIVLLHLISPYISWELFTKCILTVHSTTFQFMYTHLIILAIAWLDEWRKPEPTRRRRSNRSHWHWKPPTTRINAITESPNAVKHSWHFDIKYVIELRE